MGQGRQDGTWETRGEQFLPEALAVTDRNSEEPSAVTVDDGTVWNLPQW